MRLLRVALRPETAVPMLALGFVSIVNGALVFARILKTGNLAYSFLFWNLFLAWLPLVFSLLAWEKFERGQERHWLFVAFSAAWLLFFPNAPYIFTDVIHLTRCFYAHFWVDLSLILSCALTGLVLGFVSLYLMQSMIRRLFGIVASWAFIAAVAGLSGFGIYLGRFLRFNSWDVLFKPLRLYEGIGHWFSNPLAHPTTYAFPALFGLFLFLAYLMLYALTHLQPTLAWPRRSARRPRMD